MTQRDDRPTILAGGSGSPLDTPQGQPTRAVSSDDWSPGGYDASSQDTLVLKGKKPRHTAWLVRKDGPREGHIHHLNQDATTIGRDAQCDIILDDEAVSRQHAKIKLEETESEGARSMRFFIYDLASENGTTVNGAPVLKQMLADGDTVVVARTALIFKNV